MTSGSHHAPHPGIDVEQAADVVQLAEERLLVGPGYVDGGYAFCRPDGAAYDPDRFSREFPRKQEQFNRAGASGALPRLTLHGLRHTWATLALHDGIDIKVVSARLSHSSTFVTREIYTQSRRRCELISHRAHCEPADI